MPIPFLECTHMPYEMGHIQGKQIDNASQEIVDLLFDLTETISGLPFPAFNSGKQLLSYAVGKYGEHWIRDDLTHYYPRMFERTQGIADGAKVPLSMLFIIPAIETMMNNFSQPKLSTRVLGGCSTLAIANTRFETNEPVIAKNFDYTDIAKHMYLLRKSKPYGKAHSIDVTATPMTGSHEGINEDGLAVTYNYGFFHEEATGCIPLTFLVQEILEECKTTQEALNHLNDRPKMGSSILTFADATGDIAIVELSPQHMSVRNIRDHNDMFFQTNHAITDEMHKIDLPHDTTLSRLLPKKLRGFHVMESSLLRQDRLRELTNPIKVFKESDLHNILSDHNGSLNGNNNTICMHGDPFRTTCSMLLFPKRRQIKIMFSMPCRGEWETFSL